MVYTTRHRALGACTSCQDYLRPGDAMPRDLMGLGAVDEKKRVAGKPVPSGVSYTSARRVQIAGIMISAVFAVGGLIAISNDNKKTAHSLTLLSILSGSVVGIAQIFAEESAS